MTGQKDTKVINTAWIMSFAGLLPFLGLAIMLLFAGKNHALFIPLVELFKTWSAVILSFLGGIRWGLVVRDDNPTPGNLFAPMIPVVLGWGALLMPEPLSILVLDRKSVV